MVSKNITNVKDFDNPRRLTNQKRVDYFPLLHKRVAQIILYMMFSMSVATRQCLNYSRQKSEEKNPQSAVNVSDKSVTLK